MLLKLSDRRPLIMGIINVTPDSFSGDGMMLHKNFVAAALDQAQRMMEEGADLLDIGGESSRPGSMPVSVQEEISRVIPVLEAIKNYSSSVTLSIDTTKSEVATAALDAGASIVNDISALAHDPLMAGVVAQRKSYVVLMHNKSDATKVAHDEKIGGEYKAKDEGSIINTVISDLKQSIILATQNGIDRKKIILDPGIGFGKTVKQNLSLINQLALLKELGYPIMIGPSRKSFIGRVLNVSPEERLEGTAATVAVGTLKGAAIVRVHDVQFMSRVVEMTATIAQN